MKRLGHLCVICLFLAFIYLPPVLSVLIKDRAVSLAEKRRLARRPHLEFTLSSLARFPKQLEIYYKDHFGLREQLIQLHNKFYFYILRKSPLPGVTVGQDNWLFYNGDGALADFFGLPAYPEAQYETWKRLLEDREEWLGDLGIRYLCVVAPNKMMVYPEKLPPRVRERAGTTQLGALADYLARHARLSGFVDLRGELLAAKQRGPLYYRLDTHWNADGALVGYGAIISRIRQWFPQVEPLTEKSLKKTPETRNGDIRIMLNVNSLPAERSSRWDAEPARCPPRPPRVAVDFKPPPGWPRDRRHLPYQNSCSGGPLTVLLIQDSFGQYLHGFFNETFGRVIYSNFCDLKDIKGLFAKEKPEVIVDLRVARHLNGLLKEDPEIERAILKKHFPLSTDVRLSVGPETWSRRPGKTSDLLVQPRGDGLLLRASGNDPAMEFTFAAPPEREQDPLLVRLVMVSPADTVMAVYYTTQESPVFSKEQVVSRQIRRGENEVLFRLPHPRTAGRIRFDPGMVPGDYLLKSFVVAREGGRR